MEILKIIITSIKNNLFRKDKLILSSLAIGLLSNFFIWGIVYYKLPNIEDNLIPLYYNIYFGIGLIGQTKELFKLPQIGLIIYLFNFCLAYFLYSKNKFLSHSLIICSILIQFLLILVIFLLFSII
ncbi:MAG: hypothetical protein ABH808_02380 [Candidatus Kuenenbacteria bacterium]